MGPSNIFAPARPETHLQVAAGSQRHFSLVKALLGSQSEPRQGYQQNVGKSRLRRGVSCESLR